MVNVVKEYLIEEYSDNQKTFRREAKEHIVKTQSENKQEYNLESQTAKKNKYRLRDLNSS